MKYLSFLIALLLAQTLFAQNIDSASRRDWIGGPCCVSGSDYTLKIANKRPVTRVSVHRVWLKDMGQVQANVNMLTDSTFSIHFSISTDNHVLDYSQKINGILTTEAETPEFEGAALIMLTINSKVSTIEVKEFSTSEPVVMH